MSGRPCVGNRYLSVGILAIITCASITCSNKQPGSAVTIRWNFRVGDKFLYKRLTDFPDHGLGVSRGEVVEEIEVLIDRGNGEYRLGSIIQEAYAKWKDGEWRGGQSTSLPDKGVPGDVELLTMAYGQYSAISLTNWGFVMAVKECQGREQALNEQGVEPVSFLGYRVLPFGQLLLPKTQVIVGERWREKPSTWRLSGEVVTAVSEGRLLAAGERTCEFECMMSITAKRVDPPLEAEVKYPSKEVSAKVKWRNDPGVLEHCILEEKDTIRGRATVKRVEVRLLSVMPREKVK